MQRRTASPILAIAVLPLATLLACGTARPPKELVEARAAYQRAEAGNAGRLVPAELHVAKRALDTAESSFSDSPESQDTIDNSYIALRKIQRAEALGTAALSLQDKASFEKSIRLTQQELLSRTSAKLRTTEGALAKERDSLAKEKDATAAERAARVAAEQKAKDALDELAKKLEVKSEARGTVITLSGALVFTPGRATILPGARTQLDQVADALKSQAEHHFSVEGHTDNQGTDAVNDKLSTRRANAVRDYLVTHGVAPAAITATGFGSSRPVGDNKTAEGRAMNRRVEIIVDKVP
ncbi:MAG TPA: OmpA family protein [Kofleriaceae bacterium]|nr:OmpA family protein [Kofleriaceae bacterium]